MKSILKNANTDKSPEPSLTTVKETETKKNQCKSLVDKKAADCSPGTNPVNSSRSNSNVVNQNMHASGVDKDPPPPESTVLHVKADIHVDQWARYENRQESLCKNLSEEEKELFRETYKNLGGSGQQQAADPHQDSKVGSATKAKAAFGKWAKYFEDALAGSCTGSMNRKFVFVVFFLLSLAYQYVEFLYWPLVVLGFAYCFFDNISEAIEIGRAHV